MGSASQQYTVLPSGAQLTLQQTVRDILTQRHPPAQPAHPETLLQSSPFQKPHPVLFEQLDGEIIRMTALQAQSGVGPSGMDSHKGGDTCALPSEAPHLSCVTLYSPGGQAFCTTTVDTVGPAPITLHLPQLAG